MITEGEPKVFDWNKAARLIAEYGESSAIAGLSEDRPDADWEIFREGKPNSDISKAYHLESTWATPVLVLGEREIDCYKSLNETDNWWAMTFWPDSALKILQDNWNRQQPIKRKVFVYQTSLSSDLNGWFDIASGFATKEEVYNHYIKSYHKVFNIVELELDDRSTINYGKER